LRTHALDLPVAFQNPQGDGEIERGPFLRDVGGCEVYGDTLRRPRESGRRECVSEALPAFLDRWLPKPHYLECGAWTERDFDFYGNGRDALDKCASNHLGPQHNWSGLS
jgi:hypothetical protein